MAVDESFADVTSFLHENKNASATHLNDLLGIPDFEEKRASGGEQQNEAVSF